MSSSFVTQLFDLAFSPIGLVGIVVGLMVVLQARRSRVLSWGLFSLCCLSASLAKFRDQFVSEPPALAFPLQQIRDFGRPLTIIFLLLLLLLTFSRQPSWRRQLLASPIKYLAVVQAIIFCKTLYYGDLAFALLASCTFTAVLIVMIYGPSSWLTDNKNFQYAVNSVVWVGAIFIVANAYQAAIDIYPITFIHGRFLGTTGNPQHAAVLLASTIPCFVFLFESCRQKWTKISAAVGLACIFLALSMTGSRTGMLMATVTVLFFYRNKNKSLFQLGIALSVILAIVLPLIFKDGALLGAQQTDISSRFLSTDNTRAQVWSAMWRSFDQNPVFGAPLVGDRLGFGESSWLAAGANLGLVGLMPLVLFGAACMRLIAQLMVISQRHSSYSLHCSAVISGIACLLVGSFFEAFLLGNLSSAVLILFIYLSLGQYLLDLHKAQTDSYLKSQTHLQTPPNLSSVFSIK